MPTVLAITSDHAFASILMDTLAAEYLMTSVPQINVPIGGGREYMSTDLKHSVFQRPTGLLDATGTPIIKPALRSVGAILLMAVDHLESRIVGLLHPDAANPFNPQVVSDGSVREVRRGCSPVPTSTRNGFRPKNRIGRRGLPASVCTLMAKGSNKSTYGEDVLAAYLTANGVAFEREPKLPGVAQLIDFVIDHPTHGKICSK